MLEGMAEPGEMPNSTSMEVAALNTPLSIAMTKWLKKHGKVVRPKLSEQQKAELRECFKLMDEDGSGAIDTEELGAAFKLLGINLKRSDLVDIVNEVDHDGTGELEYPEFLEVMTDTLYRLSEMPEGGAGDTRVPFALMSTAYRRKKLLEGIMGGDRGTLAQIVLDSEAAERDKERAEKMAEMEALESALELARNKGLPKGMLKRTAKKSHIDAKVFEGSMGAAELRVIQQVASKHTGTRPHSDSLETLKLSPGPAMKGPLLLSPAPLLKTKHSFDSTTRRSSTVGQEPPSPRPLAMAVKLGSRKNAELPLSSATHAAGGTRRIGSMSGELPSLGGRLGTRASMTSSLPPVRLGIIAPVSDKKSYFNSPTHKMLLESPKALLQPLQLHSRPHSLCNASKANMGGDVSESQRHPLMSSLTSSQ